MVIKMVENSELRNFRKMKDFQRRKRNQSLYNRASNFFETEEYPIDEETFMTLNRLNK